MKLISKTIQKLKSDYKPLGVAVFLAIGGLLSGVLMGSVFVSNPAGMVQKGRVSDSALIPQAEGAEVDSAALTPASAPFLASANAGAAAPLSAENIDVLYNEGAVRDPGQVIKTKTAATTASASSSLASGVIYKVGNGDTLSSISAAFNVPIDMIVEFNQSVNFLSLTPGISIVIPSENNILPFAG